MKKYGLIGFPLSHSFSESYFTRKFRDEHINGCIYTNYPLPHIDGIDELLRKEKALAGLNVTIPYKESVIPYLDTLSGEANEIGAVNTIRIIKGKREGYNTDVYGFRQALEPLLRTHHKRALVLGSGGASKAVVYVLEQLGISYKIVSRTAVAEKKIEYGEVSDRLITDYPLVINTTPLGMYPDTGTFPPLPYEAVTARHLFFDLVYNPSETRFLQAGKERGATVTNGYQMLVFQAEKSWEIWNR